MAENGTASEQQFSIQRIYLKDLSFETPLGVEAFKAKWEPQIQLDMNTRTEKVGDDAYEVVLSLTVTAKQEDKTAFLVEVQQAGIFKCAGLNAEQLRQVHSTMCPSILFPYARETIDSMVIKGSFPALMLAPMNFDALYQQAMQQHAAQQSAEATAH